MENIIFDMSLYGRFFMVPSDIVDLHLKDASESDLKIILYLLRNQNTKLSIELLKKDTGLSSSRIEASFNFWREKGVMAEKNGRFYLVNNIVRKNELTPNYDISEIQDKMAESEFSSFVFQYEELIGHTISKSDLVKLYGIYDYHGLPFEVILTCVSYCKALGKTGIAYIEKVCATWSKNGINTLEKADKYLMEQEKFQKAVSKIKNLLGINRAFTENEKKYISLWLNEQKASTDLIKKAYDIAADRTGRLSFAYMNKLLDVWARLGLKTPVQVEEYKKANPSPKTQDYDTPNYDIDKYFKGAIEKTIKEGKEGK
ncbi:MAG: DnaD domain protein [Clostridia bacterium]|nr:DnaD domain protein [Clostridia bacterium]